jgi:hypothetical protein
MKPFDFLHLIICYDLAAALPNFAAADSLPIL